MAFRQFSYSPTIERFQPSAEIYNYSRPAYPKEAIQFLKLALGIRRGKSFIDLAAGTGKLTESLLDSQANLIAIEPIEGMRLVYAKLFPNIVLLNGKAESIPLAASSMDGVVVGTAFHGFDGCKALPEIARVLKLKGGLGLIWNVLDDNVKWVKNIISLRNAYAKREVKNCYMEWKTSFECCSGLFSELQHRTVSFSYLGNVQAIIDRMLSSSVIIPLTEIDKNNFVEDIIKVLNVSSLKTQERDLLIPYRTEIYWAFKLKEA